MVQHIKVTEKENKGLRRSYEVVVAAKAIEDLMQQELRKVGQRAKIPGFRPGKVPPAVLKQRYGKSVIGDVIRRTASEASQDIIRKNKLVPALAPDVKVKDRYEEGKDLALAISMEIMPTVPSVDFSKIAIEKRVVTLEEEEIDKALEVLRQRFRNLKDKEGAAKQGDVLCIAFTGYVDGKAFEGGTTEHFHVELGAGQLIPGFEEQLIGTKVNDALDVNVTFPEQYHQKELAGKKAKFEVTVHEVKTVELPEIDEAFAKRAGTATVKELRANIKAQIARDYENVARNHLKKDLFDALDPLCDFDVPEGMLKLEFDSIWRQYEHAKKQGAVEEKQSDQEAKDEYRAIALRRVRLGILLSDTARRQEIKVTNEELTRAIQAQARMYPGQESKIFEHFRDHPEHLDELRGPILEEKAVDYILSQVKMKEKAVSAKELLDEEQGEQSAAPKKTKSEKKSTAKKPKAKK